MIMLKSKKYICIIIISILIITIALIFLLFNKSIFISKEENNENVSNTLLSNEQKEEAIINIQDQFKGKTDNVLLEVNGEKITEKDIELVRLQTNNKYIKTDEKDKSDEEILQETIRQNVILQDAKKNGIILSQIEEKEIEDSINKYIEKDKKETQEVANALGMNNDSFIEFYKSRTKKLEIISKWKINITTLINNDRINIEDEKFNKKYEEYKNCTDNKQRTSLMLELISEYENYLIGKSEIKYIQ